MEEELYKKIYIKSNADLPKEEGTYFALTMENRRSHESFEPKSNVDVSWWMQNIDWYLLPLPSDDKQEEEPETLCLSCGFAPSKESSEQEDKLIDFANWYLRLIKVTTDKNERFDIENREIVWSFLRGDDYKLWWDKIESSEQERTAEEILKKHLFVVEFGKLSDLEREFNENMKQVNAIISAMTEYASQFASQSNKVNDEEIDNRFPINVAMIRPCNLSTHNKWIQQGIQWLRDHK